MEKTKRSKTMKQTTLITIIMVVLAFTTCDTGGGGKPEPVEQPKDQTATISNLFGKNISVTVKGTFTDEEWAGVPDKIKTAIEDGYSAQVNLPAIQAIIEEVYGRGVTIIVEKTPSGYTKYKTTTDGKTVYLAYGELDNNLTATFHSAFQWMYEFEEKIVKAAAPQASILI
jgi:predicted transcriptional regulator